MKKLLLFSVVLLGFSMTSCGGDDDCSQANLNEQIQLLSAAANTYGMSPTTENCNAYVDVINDYLDVLENCPGTTQSEIDDLRQQVTDLDCN